MRKRKHLYSTKEVCDLHLEVFLTYCGKLLIDASWFGVIGDNSATLITAQTERFNKHTEWDDENAIELYDLASKENAK